MFARESDGTLRVPGGVARRSGCRLLICWSGFDSQRPHLVARMFFTYAWYAGRVMLEPVTRRRRSAARTAFWLFGLTLAACAVAVAAALIWWPEPRVESDAEALAHVVQPGYAGDVSSVMVRGSDGRVVPIAVRHGRLWP